MNVTRTFTMDDQLWFAARSGDWNPLHVDALAARRILFGGPVVHGIHLTMWAANSILSAANNSGRIARIQGRFENPLLVGVQATVEMIAAEAREIRIRVSAERPLAAITLNFNDGRTDRTSHLQPMPSGRPEPQAVAMDEMAGKSGTLPLFEPAPDVAATFPALHGMLGDGGVSVLFATTRLVGMQCPGLNSIFGSLDLSFSDASGDAAIGYDVERADPRFSMLTMKLEGYGSRGQIQAFMRPAPATQADVKALSALVKPGEFAGHKVLVIGGSRGLGEIVAKLVAIGGGETILTYHQGADDASRIVADIENSGGRASAIALDVGAKTFAPLASMNDLTGLFFFAAPKISLGRRGSFDPVLFGRLSDVFVSSACRIALELAPRCKPDAAMFYPSTEFLDEAGQGGAEYSAAKAAGETAWRELGVAYPALRFVSERLPRLRTDQTASLQGTPAPDAAPVILSVLRTHLERAEAAA